MNKITDLVCEDARATRQSQWDSYVAGESFFLVEGVHFRPDSDTSDSKLPKEGTVRSGLNLNAKKRTTQLQKTNPNNVVKVSIKAKKVAEGEYAGKRALKSIFNVVQKTAEVAA